MKTRRVSVGGKPFSARNPTTDRRHRPGHDHRPAVGGIQRVVAADHRQRYLLLGLLHRGRQPAAERRGARRRRQGRHGRVHRTRRRQGEGRLQDQECLHRQREHPADQAEDAARREVPVDRLGGDEEAGPARPSRCRVPRRCSTSTPPSPSSPRRSTRSTPPNWPRPSTPCRHVQKPRSRCVPSSAG